MIDTANSYPVLPLRDIVVFPHMIVPLYVGRDKSVRALEQAMQASKEILLVSQKEVDIENPSADDIYTVGVLGEVLQILKMPDGTVKVLVEGQNRAQMLACYDSDEYMSAQIEPVNEQEGDAALTSAIMRNVAEQFDSYTKMHNNVPDEVIQVISETQDPSKLADLMAGHLNIKIDKKQELLETLDVSNRLEQVFSLIQEELSVLKVEKKIKTRVKSQMERTQREYYLNEQMKAIQKELGDGEDVSSEVAELEAKIVGTKLSQEAQEKAESELKKLKNMPPMSAEATVVRNYLDWMLSIPWGVRSRIKKDLKRANQVLDNDHYGLEKVKERIIEYLAVQQRSKKLKGPIMCLVGPPGVGKTSLGKSVARATGREFIRISLGGVRDESEIRGHRRTYIGSMPGKIIQALKRPKPVTRLFCWMKLTKWGKIFAVIPLLPCLKCWTRSRTLALSIIILRWNMICRM